MKIGDRVNFNSNEFGADYGRVNGVIIGELDANVANQALMRYGHRGFFVSGFTFIVRIMDRYVDSDADLTTFVVGCQWIQKGWV